MVQHLEQKKMEELKRAREVIESSSLLTPVREGSLPSTLDARPVTFLPPPVLGLGEVYRLYGHPAGPPAILPPPPVGLQVSRLHR
jgi:hypothetical protein